MTATLTNGAACDSRPVPRPRPAGRRATSVFVLIDGLGWTFIRGREFLSALLPYRQPVRTVLGFSSGAIPTILTGAYPSETGHWNLYCYDPAGSPFAWLRRLAFLPDAALDNRLARKLIKELGRRVLGVGAQFECQVSPRLLPFFNFIERRSIYRPRGVGGAHSIFDRLAERGLPYRVYTYRDGRDVRLVNQALADIGRRAASFYFVYLSELDGFLHRHCLEEPALRRKMGFYESELERLFVAALVSDPAANLAVLSDHGMTPVTHHVDLMGRIEALGFRMPADYLAVYDSTMARFWFFSPAARAGISRCLETAGCGSILGDDELCRLSVFFADRRYGELIFPLDPGWLLTRSDFHGRGWLPNGMHGYHPSDPFSDAVFLGNRPPPVPVHDLADVYRVLLAAVDG